MKYQWKFDGNVATFIALQTMWQTPPSTDRHEPMEGCFTSLQPRPWKVHEKYQIFFLQVFAVAKFVKNNLKVELPIQNSCY